jgi:adenylate cyclase
MTEQTLPHKLAAILYADVEGYSRLTGADESGTHRTLSAYLDLFAETIKTHRGEVKHYAGDAVLADLSTVSDALNCAVSIQKTIKEKSEAVPTDKRVQFRIGLNLGEVIVDRGEVYGNGVNVAARLETLAEPGGICASGTVVDAIGTKLNLAYEFLGEQRVKNIEKPVSAYRVNFTGEPSATQKTGSAPTPQARNLWPFAAAALLALIGLTAWFALRPAPVPTKAPTTSAPAPAAAPTSAPTLAKANRIAVLPFANLSADKDNEYFSDGMTEEMISKLSRVPGLEVIARTSIITYKASNKKVAEIAKELNVGTVLEGSVRRTGDKLRITAQLINASNETHLWSNDYDRELKDVFAIQSEVARNVAEALRVTLSSASLQQVEKRGTENLEAYDLFLQGLYHQNTGTQEGLEKSLVLFEGAIEKDNRFARVYAAIALSYDILGISGMRPQEVATAKQMEAAQKALELDEQSAEAHSEFATAKLYRELDWATAEKSLNRAIELNPNSALTHDQRANNFLCPLGRHQEAVASQLRSIELDPRSAYYQGDPGWQYWCMGDYHRAIKEFGKAVSLEPNQALSHWGIGMSYGAVRQFEESIASMKKYVELSSGAGDSLGALGWAYATAGQRAEALATLEKLKEQDKKGGVEKIAYAYIYSALGNKDKAFEWLEKVYNDRAYQRLLYLNVGNWFDPLRGDPRFDAFVKKLGLVK